MLAGTFYFSGCGSANGPQVIHGSLTVGDRSPDTGEIRFVPIEGTHGSMNAAAIVQGEYRIEGRGGLPVGKYRVEIIAKKNTGQKVRKYNGFEMVLAAELVTISRSVYAGTQSPLSLEVLPHSDRRADFHLPAK